MRAPARAVDAAERRWPVLRLWKNLDFLLQHYQITAADLSRSTGVPKQTISGWLANGSAPRDLEALGAIARHLKVSIDDLLFRVPAVIWEPTP